MSEWSVLCGVSGLAQHVLFVVRNDAPNTSLNALPQQYVDFAQQFYGKPPGKYEVPKVPVEDAYIWVKRR